MPSRLDYSPCICPTRCDCERWPTHQSESCPEHMEYPHPNPECRAQVHFQQYARRMAKRGYSREFTPRSERRIKIEIDRVPPMLAEALRAKSKRDGISIRALTLRLWKQWLESVPQTSPQE